jgi:hypothetical protein
MTVTYRHPELGFELELPEELDLREDVPGMALIAVEPEAEPSSGFRANLVVTVEPVAAGTTLGGYTDAALRAQADLLASHYVIDRETTAVRGGAAVRTLAHHAHAGHAVTAEQWRTIAGTLAYTVTASCATLDYAAVADGFRDVAESLVPA